MTELWESFERAETTVEVVMVADSLIDRLLEGGSALTEDAPAVVEEMLDVFFRSHSYRSWVLGPLNRVPPWLGIWTQMASPSGMKTPTEEVLRHAEAERVVRGQLASFASDLMAAPLPVDLEERALGYRLIGMSGQLPESVSYLRESYSREVDPLVRATALEGFATAIFRSGKPSADDLSLVKAAIESGDPVVLTRLWGLDRNCGSGWVEHREMIESELGLTLPLQTETNWRHSWPAERL